MFVHHIAYRHENGDLETFRGAGLTPATAHQNSVYAAKHAVTTKRDEAFLMTRIVADHAPAATQSARTALR